MKQTVAFIQLHSTGGAVTYNGQEFGVLFFDSQCICQYAKTWRHPQNQKFVTLYRWCMVVSVTFEYKPEVENVA